jgi:hypothetical protein
MRMYDTVPALAAHTSSPSFTSKSHANSLVPLWLNPLCPCVHGFVTPHCHGTSSGGPSNASTIHNANIVGDRTRASAARRYAELRTCSRSEESKSAHHRPIMRSNAAPALP